MATTLRPSAALSFLLATLCACSVARPGLQLPDQPLPAAGGAPLKAHLQSGELVVFEVWEERHESREIVGTGQRFGTNRLPLGMPGSVRLPVDSIALIEVTRAVEDLGLGAGVTLLATYTVLTGLIAITCAMDPKSCFGSCPTFYVDGPDGERLVAEGFSSSIARALEESDIDDLRMSVPPGPFSLRMRNEALETHAVRGLRLHAVPESPGRRVFATPDGRFLETARLVEPARCAAPEGDCAADLRALDGRERFSWTDEHDLGVRETIELDFPDAGPRTGLVVAARHSFVSTFLFYQMLAYLGREAGTFLAAVERGEAGLAERVRHVKGRLGRLEVHVQEPGGEWVLAGIVDEAGPLAADVRLVELPERGRTGPLRVRLVMTRGYWRLEHVGLAEIVGEVPAVPVSPIDVQRLDDGRPAGGDAFRTITDPDRHLVTGPGDHYRVDFVIPRDGDGGAASYRLFLESTGYYYEWMRPDWLAEESAAAVATMLVHPEVMFRQLAPAFKKLEAGFEEAFWSSRFRR
jgi:hypothetical protein